MLDYGQSNSTPGMMQERIYADRTEECCNDVRLEVQRAMVKHPKPLVSLHEAHSVIREEFDEFWDEVKKQKPDPEAVKLELLQTAAMCVRALVELEVLND